MRLHLQPILLAALFLVLPVMANAQTQNAITEAQLTALVNTVDSASRKGNINGVVATFAKDVKIKMIVVLPSTNEEKVLNLSRDQFAIITRNGMRQRLAYTLLRKNTRFKIYEGGKTAL